MFSEMKRMMRYAGWVVILAALLLGGNVGRAGALSWNDFRSSATPPARSSAPVTPAAGAGMPRVSAALRRASPPPFIETAPASVTAKPPSPEEWKEWPVLPQSISAEMRQLYQRGLRQGTNPRAFSVIGDCQSQPEFFMGVFDTDPSALRRLPAHLRATARHFAGSFGRPSPTVQDGITAGAVLWGEWAKKYQGGRACLADETPLDCELRLNNPSIVFIHIGTHWESRNERYLTMIIETIKAHGAVPVMVTKADNREKDERINLQSVQVAHEQGIPVWNFWASVQGAPNHGLETGSNYDLNEQALAIRRYAALQALDIIWRAVKQP